MPIQVPIPNRTAMIKAMVFISVMLMDLLVGMEFDLFIPSFPALQSHFALTPFWVEALLSANFIGFCLSLFVVGSLADRYGRRLVILSGLLIFIAGSMLCLWIPYYPALLIGRCLQGIGIAAPTILSFLIIADTYPLKQQQFLMAMLNASINTAVAIAPVIGSYITLYFHWQGNFAALLLLGIVTFVMTVMWIPTYTLPSDMQIQDESKQATLLQEKAKPSTTQCYNKIRHFWHNEYRPLFCSKPLLLLMTTIVLIFLPYWVFVGMSPLLYMNALGVSLAHFGYYQGILALIFAIGSLLFGLVVKRLNQRYMLYVTIAIFMVSFLSIGLVTFMNNHNPLMITLAFIPFIIGQIIPSTILYPLCLNLIPHAKARIAAMIQGGRLLLASLSLQLAGYFYHDTFQSIGIIIIGIIAMIMLAMFQVIQQHPLHQAGMTGDKA